MTNAKQLAMKKIAELPEDCSWRSVVSALEFLPPWQRIGVTENQLKEYSEAELKREAINGHPLFGLPACAIARGCGDDVLYAVGEPPIKYAVVHLTRKGGPEISRDYPNTELFDSFDHFAEERMLSDAADFEGDCLEKDYRHFREQGG